ncbi:MAG: DUF1028 domain-containing protein [Dehalococcoidia bacterium]|jgi:uncharacterized Ntn-hydrolase superfamily protein|nr:DUF1028 domain-containing protein [Dehalococcoidia bacterium]|tara:strand:+ start:190 stop:897 length:708 start_codon:yes stop_codon:yes gene_type:complete
MTFSILGRDPENGGLGIAIATYSLAVGATCPQILPGIAVVTSQAATNPIIGKNLLTRLKHGEETDKAFDGAIQSDSYSDFRQVALLANLGNPKVHTGKKTKPFAGSISSKNSIAVGNFLTNENVLETMVETFEKFDKNSSLADRMIASLKSGKETGGQTGSDGSLLPERSACIMVAVPGEAFPIDVRIDFSFDAILDLSVAYNAYLPMHRYYLDRAKNPVNLPAQDTWIKRLGSF